MAIAPTPEHVVSITCEGQTVTGWESYNLETNMVVPADAFTLSRPFDPDAFRTLRMDARVRVSIDGAPILDGFIEKRLTSARSGTMTVSGRDRVGRLTQESAPSINYQGIKLFEAIRKLASPWFQTITASDARNREIRAGKGRRVPKGSEPLEVNTPVPRRGKVHPGTGRWQAIEELASQAGALVWSSGDGKELFVGRANQTQPAQYLIVHAAPGSTSRATCKDLDIDEDIGDCYAEIRVVGTGGGDEANFGDNATSRHGIARDGINTDGTGNSFLYPKMLMMPERDASTNNDAQQIADREMARRNFHKTTISALMPGHGQKLNGVSTIYTPNTIARVVDEVRGFDELCLIIGVSFSCSSSGEETKLDMVPKGTEIVL